MSPPRRRSARLASGTPAKPKASPELASVGENVEPMEIELPKQTGSMPSTPARGPSTPVSSCIKPPHDEMHPGKAHASMAAPSSALRLGFSDIKPAQNPNQVIGQDGTPTKAGLPRDLSFNVQLSENAQRMMDEIRAQAAQIKAELVAQREAEGADISDRKFAVPKGKSSRFSAAHMAEFKKMDSIEGHASAWRAANFTPVKAGALKRSSSKANLDETPGSVTSGLKRSPSKTKLDDTPISQPKLGLKRKPSAASLDDKREPASAKKVSQTSTPSKQSMPVHTSQTSPAKRFKQRQGDDTSNSRASPRAAASVARPKSSGADSASSLSSGLNRLTCPTKASLAHASAHSKPTISLVGASPSAGTKSSPKPDPSGKLLGPSRTPDMKRRIISPGRFERVKSILRGQKNNGIGAKTALPGPPRNVSQTPAPPRAEKFNPSLPAVPFTTPRRKLTKHVSFTPEMISGPSFQGTPTPRRMGILKSAFRSPLAEVQYPSLDSVMTGDKTGDVTYPDLSSFGHDNGKTASQANKEPAAKPGTFTFRSDHTIEFAEASRTGFGGHLGQSSIRHVRGSLMPTKRPVAMPGSFPEPPSPSVHPDKENKEPTPSKMLFGAPHGMTNKKRHRVSTDEEDAEREEAARAAKRRKNEDVPEGMALLASKLLGAGTAKKPVLTKTPVRTPGRAPVRTPSRTPGSVSPSKKKPMLSMSRLNALARPKARA